MATISTQTPDGVFRADEIARMQHVVEAVCLELGVRDREQERRRAVAQRILKAYRTGSRQPLNLVAAGLAEAAKAG